MRMISEARQGLVPREYISIVGHDTSVLVTAVQRPPGVDAAVVVEAGGQHHEVALLREVVVVESEARGFVGAGVGLEAEGVPASSGGWESVGGWGVCGDEEGRWLGGGEGCCVGEAFCWEWSA